MWCWLMRMGRRFGWICTETVWNYADSVGSYEFCGGLYSFCGAYCDWDCCNLLILFDAAHFFTDSVEF